ncbi:hypothetical protein ACF3NT_04165 [Naumannella halotolerans]|uniref:hypothetical protein n=1 Tax=Naumannella halotolerans TaxID=993414 RepID=UPI00370D0103
MTEHSPADRRLPVVLVVLACGIALILAGQSLRTPGPAPVTPTPAPSVSSSAPSPQVEPVNPAATQRRNRYGSTSGSTP